ncbi:MAG: RNA polymerase-binding protein DksA [Burkholderiaceae bacterium]|nr:RNA polymerase-binding protein DksA [Burkholderiaceae bacterium]
MQAPPARRQEVKAKPGKVSVSSKAKSAAGKAKPAPKKAAAKPAAKAKPAVKTAKPGAAKKAVAKPAAKKPAAKPVAKKAAVKPVAKKAPAKAPATKSKPAAKPVAKAPVKAPAKAAAKAVPAKAPLKAVAAPASVPAKPSVPEAPVRTAKASARLAQLTVPSMAQTSASNAVKASYVPTMSQTLIAPPLPSSVKKDPKLANNWKTKPADQLSDEELMAMPDSEYMNDKQLAAFRVRLQQLKQDILTNAGETTEHLREDTVIVPDPADRATIEEEHALELRTRDRERKLLKKIEQSIARIDAGDYGYCDETGEPIGVGRLLARPTATLSLEAQQRRELKQKMFGD